MVSEQCRFLNPHLDSENAFVYDKHSAEQCSASSRTFQKFHKVLQHICSFLRAAELREGLCDPEESYMRRHGELAAQTCHLKNGFCTSLHWLCYPCRKGKVNAIILISLLFTLSHYPSVSPFGWLHLENPVYLPLLRVILKNTHITYWSLTRVGVDTLLNSIISILILHTEVQPE